MIDHVHAVYALAIGTAGTVVSFAAGLLANVDGAADVVPWAQVGGTATAVGALAYVAKLLADGRLVAQPIAQIMQASDRRERDLHAALESNKALALDSHERETALRALLLEQLGKGSDR